MTDDKRDVTQVLTEALDDADRESGDMTPGIDYWLLARAALAYLANVAPDAGPEPEHPLPWSWRVGMDDMGRDGEVYIADLDGYHVADAVAEGAVIEHRVNNWPALRAALAASQARVVELDARLYEELELSAKTHKRIAELEAERDKARAEDVCWHCGDALATYSTRPRCEQCPDECDIEGCEEYGCAEPECERDKAQVGAVPITQPGAVVVAAKSDAEVLRHVGFAHRDPYTEKIEAALSRATILDHDGLVTWLRGGMAPGLHPSTVKVIRERLPPALRALLNGGNDG